MCFFSVPGKQENTCVMYYQDSPPHDSPASTNLSTDLVLLCLVPCRERADLLLAPCAWGRLAVSSYFIPAAVPPAPRELLPPSADSSLTSCTRNAFVGKVLLRLRAPLPLHRDLPFPWALPISSHGCESASQGVRTDLLTQEVVPAGLQDPTASGWCVTGTNPNLQRGETGGDLSEGWRGCGEAKEQQEKPCRAGCVGGGAVGFGVEGETRTFCSFGFACVGAVAAVDGRTDGRGSAGPRWGLGSCRPVPSREEFAALAVAPGSGRVGCAGWWAACESGPLCSAVLTATPPTALPPLLSPPQLDSPSPGPRCLSSLTVHRCCCLQPAEGSPLSPGGDCWPQAGTAGSPGPR